MTTATRVDGGKLTAARAVFISVLGLALGWAGAVVAAVAVAVERAKNGDDTVVEHKTGSEGWWDRWRASRAQTTAERAANARRWLAEDRAERAEFLERRRNWARAGHDPATEPVKPGYGRRLGRGVVRFAHRARLAAAKARVKGADFVAGFKEGLGVAAPVAAAGGGFRAAAAARPGRSTPAGGEPVDAEIIDDQRGNPEQAPAPAPDPQAGPERPAKETPAGPAGSAEPDISDLLRERLAEEGRPEAGRPTPTENSGPATAGPVEETATKSGEDMAIPQSVDDVKPATNAGAVIDGDDYLDKITAGLGEQGKTLSEGDEHVDHLLAVARRLRAQAAQTMELAGDKATTPTRQACDQSLMLAQQYENAANALAASSAAVAESLEAADRGLEPGRQARDGLHQAGATGELLSTAQDG